jgi:arylsulfatase A-like enzyme
VRVGTTDLFATNMDFGPTFLELANVTIPDDFDGRSLVPLFDSDTSDWRTDFAVELNGTYGLVPVDTMQNVRGYIARGMKVPFVPTYRALRTEDWLYVEWYGGDEHEYELYDVQRDRYQLSNLLATEEGRAEHRSTTEALHARLEELKRCAGSSCR